MTQQVQIGLIGLGTVGTGVARALIDKGRLLEKRIGSRLVLKRACDRNVKRGRALRLSPSVLTTDARVVLRDPAIQVVVELIGGIEPARTLLLEAIRRGKHVVTANKALLAHHGHELFAAADRAGVDVYFEASVAGGIPIIKALREGLIANELNAILGIVNGTSNYILTRMRDKQLSFHEALAEAKAHGYAERNPSLDIDGHDAAHKLAILTLLGFGAHVPLSQIHTEGISRVSLADIQYADELGYCVKPLVIAKQADGKLEARVHPALLSKSHLLANVNGVYNAIYVHGDLVGAELFYGRGAGQNPTASAVISDLADVARNIRHAVAKRVPTYAPHHRPLTVLKMDSIETRYYMRFTVIDRPGVLATIASVLGRCHISIASVHQKERRAARVVPVVIMTHDAREADVRRALSTIDRLGVVKSKTVAIRTEASRGK
ncbi:MAG TPA: homoserine dehydrogenase [Candidatus Omnitrophica bacterium]|nr:MAG: homoserine dehydrogenase [Omnitrophica WOR_2 bacterium GWA2_63_20]OGX16242.1 MAG: homoserine dehydrogenase [Omnitrophica WOR_2 bacterium GWF2_63_9]OGX31196.1 MAG: homoserine dehydrogenase [Omnitrophica WOR_2 bacterium RIFCSPHIGHO2_12_FULL_64_13]OGX35917.1 MAG: homoserine dehydrogenase [Omnitrophica WOR_2 bacterium RIFCSPHIGHO2_02_FULL_63_39]OGX45362.1 MAG: homoserine dehydrogenase [Omnitrophica WOR_2 bacterium RIFCSPLOWO2_02_FULL_63_16]OGX49145.1 MAG: homoserine dehydrogenase [Omnitrop